MPLPADAAANGRVGPGSGGAPIALTGATGFLGRTLCAALAAEARPVRALVRDPQAAADLPAEVERIEGALDDPAPLTALVAGVDTVIHLAGLVRARRLEDFHRVNVDGTAGLLEAVARMPRPARVLVVSSLAARHPETSPYAASKRAAEALAAASGLEVCIVRPPAVYGPRDTATLPIFRQLADGLLLAPGPADARFSLIHVDDLAALLRRLLTRPTWSAGIIEPDDGRPGGYGWTELAALAAPVVGRRIRCVRIPRAVVWCAAGLSELTAAVRGGLPMLSRGKLGELWYPDWVCREPPVEAIAGWTPSIGFAEGAAQTLAWYRRHGWLRA